MSHLKIEAKVTEMSPVIGKTIKEIEGEYDVAIIGQRIISESEKTMLRENHPNPNSIINKENYLEFSGDSDKVIKLFEDCER